MVADVLAYFDETAEEFVRRRHAELQAGGLTNDEIFERIAAELPPRRSRRRSSRSASCAASSTADRR